jgi:hypothetical protein
MRKYFIGFTQRTVSMEEMMLLNEESYKFEYLLKNGKLIVAYVE